MKPLILSCMAACLYFTCTAQKSSVFFKLGINFARVSTTRMGEVDEARMLPSWQIGLMGDISVSRHFAIQPGVIYTGKGSKLKSNTETEQNYYEATSKLSYIEVPVNAVLKLPGSGKNPDFFIGIGPYAAIGVGGKREIEGKIQGVSFLHEERILYSDDDPATFDYEDRAGLGVIRRFDFGFNTTAGFVGKGLMVAFNYGYGLAKLQSGSDSEHGRNENRVISVIMGVKL